MGAGPGPRWLGWTVYFCHRPYPALPRKNESRWGILKWPPGGINARISQQEYASDRGSKLRGKSVRPYYPSAHAGNKPLTNFVPAPHNYSLLFLLVTALDTPRVSGFHTKIPSPKLLRNFVFTDEPEIIAE